MTWKIVADSSCDLLAKDFHSKVARYSTVPLKINIGEREFVDDETLNVPELLDAMSAFKGASSTACPSPNDWANAFSDADYVIVFTLTSGLSGTYNSAVLGQKMALEEDPSKKIHVIDTLATAGNMVLCIREANRLIEEGQSFEEVVIKMDAYSKSLSLLFTLSSYENLVKAGRISKFSGYLATTLGIRTIAKASDEGKIDIVHKTRGEKKAFKYLVDLMSQIKSLKDLPVVIHHCQNLEAAEFIAQTLRDEHKVTDITLLETRGLTSYYAERAGIIVSF